MDFSKEFNSARHCSSAAPRVLSCYTHTAHAYHPCHRTRAPRVRVVVHCCPTVVVLYLTPGVMHRQNICILVTNVSLRRSRVLELRMVAFLGGLDNVIGCLGRAGECSVRSGECLSSSLAQAPSRAPACVACVWPPYVVHAYRDEPRDSARAACVRTWLHPPLPASL